MRQHDHGAGGRRVRRRFKLFQPTSMIVSGENVRVHLLDLSEGGALVHHAPPPPSGSTVRLQCGVEVRTARVVWAQGARFGVSFLLPLSDAQVTDALDGRQAAGKRPSCRLDAVG